MAVYTKGLNLYGEQRLEFNFGLWSHAGPKLRLHFHGQFREFLSPNSAKLMGETSRQKYHLQTDLN